MREVVNALMRRDIDIDPHLRPYYEDLFDHVLRAAEWTESLRDMVTSVFETNLSLQDARLNTIMKKLTVLHRADRDPDRGDRLLRPERALPGLRPPRRLPRPASR